ncbi:unnamed protein product [Brassica oleracea var. botrytis]
MISTFSLLNFLAFGEFTMARRSKRSKRAKLYESDSEQISDHEVEREGEDDDLSDG